MSIDKLNTAYLGLKLKQNAIYFVDNNQLALVSYSFSKLSIKKRLSTVNFLGGLVLISRGFSINFSVIFDVFIA